MNQIIIDYLKRQKEIDTGSSMDRHKRTCANIRITQKRFKKHNSFFNRLKRFMQTITPDENNEENLTKLFREGRDKVPSLIIPKYCKETYTLLDNMVEELRIAGVDVSFFPEKARNILIRYAIKMTPQPGAIPTPYNVYDKILKPEETKISWLQKLKNLIN